MQTQKISGPDCQGRYFWPDFLGSQKSSQMAAHVCENPNPKSSLNINDLVSHKYPISIFDRTKSLFAIDSSGFRRRPSNAQTPPYVYAVADGLFWFFPRASSASQLSVFSTS